MVRLILVGYRASGKTTVAQALSNHFGCPALDADEVFEKKHFCSVGEFIQTQGEPSFRDAETVVLQELLRIPEGVLSTGGGMVLREENRRIMEDSGLPVIWLAAPANEIRRRLIADPTTASRRPALEGKDVYSEVDQALIDRERYYTEVAHFRLNTDGLSVSVIVGEIIDWLAAWKDSESRPGDASAGVNL